MDPQMTHAHGHHYDQDALHPVGGEEEHREKTSVLKKVKAKAKKIKDSLGLKTHIHSQDHVEEEEDDDDEEETVQEPGVHSAPSQSGVNSNQKSHPFDNQDQNVCPGTFQTKVTDPDVSASPLSRNSPTDSNSGQSKVSMGEDLNAPERQREDVSPAKVTRPGTGRGKETGVAPIMHSFDKMNIHDEPQQRKKESSTTTGSHEQFTPSPSPHSVSNIPTTIPENAPSVPENKMNISDEPQQHKKESPRFVSDIPIPEKDTPSVPENKMNISDEPQQHKKESPRFVSDIPIPEKNTPSVPKSFNSSTENHPQDMNVDEPTTHQSGYTDRISSVTSALADKAISAKNVVALKIGYDGGNEAGIQKDNGGETVDKSAQHPSTQQSTYTEKLSSVTSAMTDRALSAKNVVASKIGYGGSEAGIQKDNGGETVDKSAAQHPSTQQSTYTEKLSSVTSAMTDRALSAKNVVASKLGYGGTENTAAVGQEGNKGEDAKPGYGKQIASTVTGKLAPVYGTVAGVGSAVLSKMPGTGAQKETGTGAPTETGGGVVGESDKGVVSMKGYIAEKMKPGEEDKALSEVISDALHMRKGGEERHVKRPAGEVLTDAFNKRNDDDEDRAGYNQNKPMGKVTESAEVANRLGSSESERLGKVSGSESPGTGVVDKFKGAFTNWFGKGGETNPSQAFNDNASSHGTEEQGMPRGENVNYEGERKLQESSN